MTESEIVGFHTDDQGDWVAELKCGHTQHVRHNPPWSNRVWVTTAEGRERFLGHKLACRACESGVAGSTGGEGKNGET